MTQQPPPLDQFEHVRAMVNAQINASAARACAEISAMVEFARRSLGQTTRRAIERIGR